jgi:choline/glycine/proline betaine transport protein
VIALSPTGKIRLGQDHTRPEFNILTSAAMLFAAGIGIGLLFLSIVEPVSSNRHTVFGSSDRASRPGRGRAVQSSSLSFTGVCLTGGSVCIGWNVTSVLQLSTRVTSFHPIFALPIIGEHIYGSIVHSVDIAAVIGTVFGLATNLGIGFIQQSYGLNHVLGLPNGVATQVL